MKQESVPRGMKHKFVKDMFDLAGVRHETLLKALKQMGPKYLKNQKMKRMWSPENPTCNYCYVVAEFIYWYLAPEGSTVWLLQIPNHDTLHWFVKWPNKVVVDLTCEQFHDVSNVDYSVAKKRMFLQTGCKGPSKRARILAGFMGCKDRNWKNI